MLTLIKAGIFTTIQDNGRWDGSHLGIPVSGAMDKRSAEMANLLLGNESTDALLECTFCGPKIKFHLPTIISIIGAETQSFLNDIEINHSKAIKINGGDILSFGRFKKGCRIYIAIKGGILSKKIFGSRSACTTSGILHILRNNDQLEYKQTETDVNASVAMKRLLGNNVLHVLRGPEFHLLPERLQDQLFESTYQILPSSNRMAYRVKHDLDLIHSHSILSSGTLPGTVQWTPSGNLIFLMRDAQTTGGYPRILQLTEEAINDLSQLSPNESFSLHVL